MKTRVLIALQEAQFTAEQARARMAKIVKNAKPRLLCRPRRAS